MEDARQLSISHVRKRRFVLHDKKTVPCNQTGILVAKNHTMLYISNLFIHRRDNKTDEFKNTTNEQIDETKIDISYLASGLS